MLLRKCVCHQHRRRSWVNFRGTRHFGRENMYEKLTKCQKFTWFLPEKLSIYENFYNICPKKNKLNCRILHDFRPKTPEFYIIIARKKFFPRFFVGGGGTSTLFSVSYAYVCQLEIVSLYIRILEMKPQTPEALPPSGTSHFRLPEWDLLFPTYLQTLATLYWSDLCNKFSFEANKQQMSVSRAEPINYEGAPTLLIECELFSERNLSDLIDCFSSLYTEVS